MSKARKPVVALIIAFVVFVSFVGATRFYISQNVDLVSVVAANDSIPPRTQIGPNMLKVIEIPRGYAPDDAAPNVNVFQDEVYYTGELGLHAGEIITKEKVFTEDAMAQAHTLTLAPNETILGISTDLVRSAGASIYPGSKVRALAYVEPVKEGWDGVIEPSRVEVIFDNIRVVGIINSEAHDTSDLEQRGRVPSVVKIAVTPEQERILIQYQEEHRVWFTVLPEGYVPDPNIEDYYVRLEKANIEIVEETASATVPRPAAVPTQTSPVRTF